MALRSTVMTIQHGARVPYSPRKPRREEIARLKWF
jgi:hypothetical protein